jgi:hypothetical protein
MKKMSTALLCILLVLNSCKKDNLSSYRNQFSGKWEYVRYVGYPFTFTTLPPGNGNIIIITADGSFQRNKYDTIIFKGKYSLIEKKDCYGDENYIFFKTTDPFFVENSTISLAGDSLNISTSNCLQDGGTSIYRKL